MKILPGVCWGLIPARGGSKSIPMKNLVSLAGKPLLDYQVEAARASGCLKRLICSTDSDVIAAHCQALGVEVHRRPETLAQDDSAVIDVIAHLLADLENREGAVAEAIALLQPTSPFLTGGEVADTVTALLGDGEAASAQTVVRCPHNHHAVNQRRIEDGRVSFCYPQERAVAYNKQRKTPHYLFGNLLVFRSAEAVRQMTPFPGPSLAVEIPFLHGFDLDGPLDLKLAEMIVESELLHG